MKMSLANLPQLQMRNMSSYDNRAGPTCLLLLLSLSVSLNLVLAWRYALGWADDSFNYATSMRTGN